MGRALAHQVRWWQLILASAVSAALGAAVTVAAQGASASGDSAAGARPSPAATRAVAAPGTGVVAPDVRPYMNPQQLKAVPAGPGPVSAPVKKVLTSPVVTTALNASGIPTVALEAYQRAAASLAVGDATCHLPWQLLAAIGRVESDNGQFGGAVLLPDGDATKPIYGIPLDGRDGVALVRDTVDASVDGDPNFARAVGPMQFLPSTWAEYGADGNGDGKKDVNNIFDAALGAADYLCAGGGDMAIPAQEAAAVLRYNDADEYVHVVLALAASYEQGDFATLPTTSPTGSGGASAPGTSSSSPAGAPAPATTPVQSPSQTASPPPATPLPTTPSSPVTEVVPSVNPVATPTGSPSPSAAESTPATPSSPDWTSTGSAPSGTPTPTPTAPSTRPFRPGQTVDIGWAPAMRQVVVELLGTAKSTPAHPERPAHPSPRPTETGAATARRTYHS